MYPNVMYGCIHSRELNLYKINNVKCLTENCNSIFLLKVSSFVVNLYFSAKCQFLCGKLIWRYYDLFSSKPAEGPAETLYWSTYLWYGCIHIREFNLHKINNVKGLTEKRNSNFPLNVSLFAVNWHFMTYWAQSQGPAETLHPTFELWLYYCQRI